LGSYTDGRSNIDVDPTHGIRIRQYDTVKIHLQPDGDVFIGTDTSVPATTNLAIFTEAQTYNGEVVGVGDLLLGDNSANKANILWDKSAGKLQFRGGTTMQCEIGTDGKLTMGAGAVAGDALGLWIVPTSIYDQKTSLKFGAIGGTVKGELYVVDAADTTVLYAAVSATTQMSLASVDDVEKSAKVERVIDKILTMLEET